MPEMSVAPRTARALRRIVILLVLGPVLFAVAVVCVTETPALAATRTVLDARTDAMSRYDLTRVRMVNSATVRVGSRVRNLRSGLQFFSFSITPKGSRRPTYFATTVLRRTGHVSSSLRHWDGQNLVKVNCSVVGRWRPARDVVRLSFPQACLAEHGTVQIRASIGPGTGRTLPPADRTKLYRVAYRGDTSNGGNEWGSGTVAISDDAPSGDAMFQATGLKPGDTGTTCILLTYEGTLAASVRLYATATGDLAQYLDVVVEQGTGGGSGDCESFVPEGTVYAGTLSHLASSSKDYATGVGDWTPSGPSRTKTYRFTYTLQDDNAAQGLSTSATFTWEAQNT